MKFDQETLEKITAFIDGVGFKAIENELRELKKNRNTLNRITGNPFEDGQEVGVWQGVGLAVNVIDKIRIECKQLEEDKRENNHR